MNYTDWKKYYYLILKEFRFDAQNDVNSSKTLSGILKSNYLKRDNLADILKDREVVVIGASKAMSISRSYMNSKVLICADSAIYKLLDRDIIPDIVVTDLDGPINDLIYASKNGAIMGVHAHGDNIGKLELVRYFSVLYGTTQAEPLSNIYNFGGFTDGDRSVFLAHEFKSKKILLTGFDFDNVSYKDNLNLEQKKKKLRFAQFLIMELKYKYKANITFY
ncbi:MAG: 6-hydroxymethylpterin diphosphokinase MptE-like protein [Thermoplasmata archaeon]